MYRHGDVLVIKTDKIKGQKLNNLILAKGEMTGHAHTIKEGEAELYDNQGTLFLRVISDTATLGHEEHKAIELTKGDYQISIQREYEPEGWRNVSD